MADTKFKVGDVVQLKSGGPKMTIATIAESEDGQTLTCTWLEHGRQESKPFAAERLTATLQGAA